MEVAEDLNIDRGARSGEHTMLWCSHDLEFQYFVSRERLSAQLAEVRRPPPVLTTALRDGSARARRDQRIAQRLHCGAAGRGMSADARVGESGANGPISKEER
jgi:hypothetical protein